MAAHCTQELAAKSWTIVVCLLVHVVCSLFDAFDRVIRRRLFIRLFVGLSVCLFVMLLV